MMLNLPISGVESVLFIVFLMIWASLLLGGFIFGKLSPDQTRRMPTLTRLLSSFVLVIAAWIWFAISQGTPVNVFAAWIAVGMSFGFVGDVFMARIFSIEPYIIYGMLAFGLGHIAYIIGMILLTLSAQLSLYPIMIILAFCWAIGLLLWYLVVYRGSKRDLIIYLALPYALLLATTVGVAMNLSFLDSAFVLVMLGAILFLISDLLLAAQLFNDLHFKYIGDVVWFLYGPGQMLIVFGVILYTIIASLTEKAP